MKSSPHFIVIDDDPVNNMLCQFVIRRCVEDANIKIFTEPEDALKHISEDNAVPGEPVLTFIFLDINMPSMTGWEFLDVFMTYDISIREHFKIFLLSSSVDDRDKERADLNPLISEFLTKPLKAEGVLHILQQDLTDGDSRRPEN